jgi:hypothetical protein
MRRNHFPAHYAQINENMLPPELFQNYTAVEYVLQTPVPAPPAFLFVVDTALSASEMEVGGNAWTGLLTDQLADWLADRPGRRTDRADGPTGRAGGPAGQTD